MLLNTGGLGVVTELLIDNSSGWSGGGEVGWLVWELAGLVFGLG